MCACATTTRYYCVREYFQILVLSEDTGISDNEVKKGLRRMFFGSADFTVMIALPA